INAGASNDSLTVTVNDITPPTANAGPDKIVLNGTLAEFNGSLSTDNVAIVNYSWDWDASDGIQSDATGVTASHLYPTFGNYTVTLTVCDAAGNNDTDTVNVSVLEIRAEAGPDQTVNEDTAVYFNGFNSSGALNYSWDFDASNGIQSDATGVNVSHVYADPGIYTVTLTINAGASNDTLTVTVNDITPPTANAGPNQIVLNGTFAEFNGSSSTDNVAIISYSWDFDASDGIQSDATGFTASHLYPAFGTYTATLTVSDAAGNNATDTVNVSVVPSIAPIGLKVVLNTDKTVTLTWAESLLGNFDIYASNTSGVSLVTPIATGYGYSWTDTDADDYSHRYYKVRAKGVVGSETIAKYDVNLVKKPGSTGKNWISMPENPAITNASSLMKAIGPNCDSINRWNPTTQKPEGWISLMGGMGTNFAVTPYGGYEVSVNANTTFTVVGIMGY
ncbi:MAG: PKD domain-containing protein, partial [Methanocellales archaeon]|nr:PKD domain-containing protein [Methanocellales archaeon]